MVSAPMRLRDGLLLLALVALPVVASLLGAPGPFRAVLNLGPGDGPYVSGFEPEYEILDRQAAQWSRPRARVFLPLRWQGAGTWSLRFAPPLGGPVRVDLDSSGRVLEGFACCGHRAFQRHDALDHARFPSPVELKLAVVADDGRSAGLWVDWVRLDIGEGGRVWLAGLAGLRPAAAVLALALLLMGAGFGVPAATGIAAPLAAAAGWGLLVDPWLVYRLASGIPEVLLIATCIVVLIRRVRAPAELAARDLQWTALLFACAYVPRALLVNQPDFYYPDLMIHTRLARLLARAGPAGFFNAAPLAAAFQEARNSVSGFPYSLAFHVPFALLGLSYDATMGALRVGGAVLASLPVVFGFPLARRLGLSPWGAPLLAFAATYPHWLSRAMLPALLGHIADLLLLAFLATHLVNLARPRPFLLGALLVAVSQAAYSFGIPVTALLVLALVGVTPLTPAKNRRQHVLALMGMGLLGAVVAFLFYYRSFLQGALALLTSASSSAAAANGPSASDIFMEGPQRFFGLLLPLLATAGALILARRPGDRPLLLAWAATAFGLQALRVLLPGIFRWNHELLFITPLLCLLAGQALGTLAAKGARAKVAAIVVAVVVSLQGLVTAWSSFASELGNAR